MKKSVLFSLIIMSAVVEACYSQKTDAKEIEQVIRTFTKAGDTNNAEALSEVLDPNYQVIMNQMFGSESTVIMNKDTYVEKIRSKEFGGKPREVKIHSIDVTGKNAIAKVSLIGKEMTFNTYFTLVQNASGKWKLINDLPSIN